MDNSEDQFNTLLAQLVARSDRALKIGGIVPPMAFGLKSDGECLVFTAELESTNDTENVLAAICKELSERARTFEIVASCISFLSYENGYVCAELENNENMCARVLIPVATVPNLHLSLSNIIVEDGVANVFAQQNDS